MVQVFQHHFPFARACAVPAAASAAPPLMMMEITNLSTADSPVNKAKLATLPTTLLGSTGRNPEK